MIFFKIFAPSYVNSSRQNRFQCCNLHDRIHIFLDNGVMTTQKHPKRCSKSSGCGALEAKHPESYQKRFLIPNIYDKHPAQFYLGLVPKPGA